jgi:hypothetical protein
MAAARDFKGQLDAKGLGLDDAASPQSSQQISTDIRTMELELKKPASEQPTTADPGAATAEQLEKLIGRQHDLVKQIDLLALDNHSLMERIVRAAAP